MASQFSDFKGSIKLIEQKLRFSDINSFSFDFKSFYVYLIELKNYRKTLREKKTLKKYDYKKPVFGRFSERDLNYQVLMYLSY